MALSKSKIDASGRALSKYEFKDELNYLELEDVFDEYRKNHLQPLSEMTIELQNLMADYDQEYYIAQRLKRKPQIVRKLQRLSIKFLIVMLMKTSLKRLLRRSDIIGQT